MENSTSYYIKAVMFIDNRYCGECILGQLTYNQAKEYLEGYYTSKPYSIPMQALINACKELHKGYYDDRNNAEFKLFIGYRG